MAGYGSDQGLTDWLSANGHTMASGGPTSAVLRQRASDYLDGLYGPRFTGAPTGGVAQERAWPRTGATAYGQSIPDDLIPDAVVSASYAAAWHESNSPGALSVTTTPGAQVTRIKVDVIERELFEGGKDGAANVTPVLSTVEGLLAPFLKQGREPMVLVV